MITHELENLKSPDGARNSFLLEIVVFMFRLQHITTSFYCPTGVTADLRYADPLFADPAPPFADPARAPPYADPALPPDAHDPDIARAKQKYAPTHHLAKFGR